MGNQMDSRNRSAFDIVQDLRALGKQACRVAILGTHNVDASAAADAIVGQWSAVVELLHFEPVRVVTGCADVGSEKAARLLAKRVTGKLAVVFHRAEATYGVKKAEEMRDIIIAQQADALLLVTGGTKVCKHARDRFTSHGKKVHELEVE